MITKIYCHTKIYWNLTKPYFQYEVGKWYIAFKFNPKSDEQIYTFKDSDMTLNETGFNKYFWTQEQFRELKIKQIIN